MPPIGLPDLFVTSEQTNSLAPQSMAAAATATGVTVDVKDRDSVVLELTLAAPAGTPTGGTITLVPMEGQQANGSDAAQVNGTDQVQAAYNATFPAVLRYRYLGGANGKLRYVTLRAVTALTGGSSPTVVVGGNVLKGGLKYAGAQPAPGSYPDTPGTPLTN
jgi:hypothetical protein